MFCGVCDRWGWYRSRTGPGTGTIPCPECPGTCPGLNYVRHRKALAKTREASSRRGRRFSERIRPRKYTKISAENIDYKDLTLLRRFISDKGKTRSRRVTGLSRKHQAQLSVAVKRAREVALLPYVGEK